MKLFLASEAKNQVSFEKLKEYIGGFEGKKIAYIPTAANGEMEYGLWEQGETWKLVNTSGAQVEAFLLENYTNYNLEEKLQNKDIIWIAGGAPAYLMYWILRSKLDLILPKLLEKGVIYVGSSAGSMITAKTNHVSTWFMGEEERGAEYLPGLDYVDFDIFPHYEDSMYDQIKGLYKGNKLYLLKNGEALIIENGKVEIFGEERLING